MKALVDEMTCTGCGLCVDTCPEVFQMGEEDVAVVIVDAIPAACAAACREAAEGCPVEAITVE